MIFTLDSRLENDTFYVKDLSLSRLLLMNDSTYPWLILVPRIANSVELIDLSEKQREELMSEIAFVSHALKKLTSCDKLNVAALGNAVPQLHIHIIARFKNDATFPSPVWGKAPAIPYGTLPKQLFIDQLKAAL